MAEPRYFASRDEDGRISGVSRRTIKGDINGDQVFTREGKWQFSASLWYWESGGGDQEYDEISEHEANDFVSRCLSSQGGTPPSGVDE